ncbi:MAG TPA: DNA/RNA nuclease SfsA [Methanocella sp.]|nr:DNA/RNA nuclease SfsA [Methanocella sp.]
MKKKLRFPRRLEEGLITARPNRFIMEVELDGAHYRCHCPSTGRIGSIRFADVPCLLSKAATARKTPYTVEAISLDPPGRGRKRWIGIDQTQANGYVAFFLREQAFEDMLPGVATFRREVKLGGSRIDFLVNGRDYLEVKMPLKDLPCEGHPNYAGRNDAPVDFERMVKHFADAGAAIGGGSRAIFLLCYVYDAPPFEVPPPDARAERIVGAARRAAARGVEHWQANFALDPDGVSLIRYFPLELF